MSGRLVFNSFSVVWSQIFTLNNRFDPAKMGIAQGPDSEAARLDKEIFENYDEEKDHLQRFILPDMNVHILLKKPRDGRPAATISGKVHVRAAVYYGKTVCLSYRFMVDRLRKTEPGDHDDESEPVHCTTDRPLSADDLILLAGAPMGSEHWRSKQTAGKEEPITDFSVKGNIQSICAEVIVDEKINWKNLAVQSGRSIGSALNRIFNFYKVTLLNQETTALSGLNSFYALVDVWEDIEHTERPYFREMRESEVISHIRNEHQKELIGLLTLYPDEWPYRRREHFDLVCGPNMGLDNDDLIYLSGSVCIVFGTYGRRNDVEEGIPWEAVLGTRQIFHMSYQEYYFVLDLIMAKRHAIRSAAQTTTAQLDTIDTGAKQNDTIESLCELFVETSKGMMALDILKHSRFEALRIQASQIEKRLEIPEAYQTITSLLTRLEGAIKTIDGLREQKRKRHLSHLLLFISIAAILGVIFDEPKFALLRDSLRWLRDSGILHIPGSEQAWALYAAEFVIAATMLLVLFLGASSLISAFRSRLPWMKRR